MYGTFSFAPPGLRLFFWAPPPTACAVGCILSPLRGCGAALIADCGEANSRARPTLVRGQLSCEANSRARPTLVRGQLSCEANSRARPTLMRGQPHARATLIVAGHGILAILRARRLRPSYAAGGPESGDGCSRGPNCWARGRTRLVNSCNFQIHACNFSHSSAINNPPRAEVWQPVVVCLNLSCPPGI